MRVAVNLLWCVPGLVGGSEEYLARQLQGLVAVDPGAERAAPTLFTLPSYPAAHPELADRFPIVSPRISGERRSRRVLAEHTWLRRRARVGAGGFDLVHHGGGTAPMVGSRPVVLTIHDLQYLEHPHFVPPRKLRYLQVAVPRSAARASVVAVPSQFVRGTVIDALGVDPDRVVVVPHGIEPSAPQVAVDEAALRARWGLGTGPVLVYPAITHPHKNHRLLLDTMRDHWADEPDLRLVFLGGRGAADADVERAIDDHRLRERVVRPGRVSADDRDAFVSIADALVFPSEYEGFGAPLIEAMALGTPVICGDHPTLREVVGDAGLVVPPDPAAWGDALGAARRSRRELVAAGRARVARYDLAASAAALLDAYERAVS